MTVKELVVFTGKNKSTVGRWVAKCTSLSIMDKLRNATKGNPADYNIDEVEEILERGSLSRDAVSILMDNARNRNSNQAVDYEKIGQMIGIAVSSAIAQAIPKIMESVKPTLKIDAPQKQDRDALRQLVNQYAKDRCLNDYSKAWHILYEELYYRNKINVSVRSKNEGIKVIDYLDRENMIPQCCAIMRELI